MPKKINCPVCGQSDQVEKASTLYLIGIGLDKTRPQEQASDPGPKRKPTPSQRALSRRLAPPASGKQATMRPIHPDMVVAALSLIAPVFLYGILTSQRSMFLPVLAILAAFYGFYFWKRKTMIARYEAQQASRQAADQRIKRGIERWMRLYYCARDDGVFEPGSQELVPADLIAGYLYRE
jgi:hypothetical protein